MISSAKDKQSISNAKDDSVVSALPNVGGAMLGWLQTMKFITICKKNVDGYTQEIASEITTQAVRQPFTAQQLSLRPKGERHWKWEMIHALPDLKMDIDDKVSYLGQTYRVMQKLDFTEYGYLQYNVAQDFNYLNEAPDFG